MRLGRYLGALGIVMVLGWVPSSGTAQPTCTLAVLPGQPLQSAIESAPSGAVICLPAGMWTQSISIQNKILTLWGAGRDRTALLGAADALADGISISGESIVMLRGLAVYSFRHGIVVAGRSHVIVRDALISGSARYGLYVLEIAQATLENSQVSYNLSGVVAWDSTHVTLQYSQIFDNKGDGIWLDFASSAWLVSNIVEGNGRYGIRVYSLENLSVCWRNVVRDNRAGDFYPEMAAQRCL